MVRVMGKAFIKGGTPIGSDSLCRTCNSSHIMTGYRESEQITMCDHVYPAIVVPFRIYECSSYYDKNRPTWQQMEKLAIDVTPAPMKPVGFKVGVGFHDTAIPRKVAEPVDDDDADDDE